MTSHHQLLQPVTSDIIGTGIVQQEPLHMGKTPFPSKERSNWLKQTERERLPRRRRSWYHHHPNLIVRQQNNFDASESTQPQRGTVNSSSSLLPLHHSIDTFEWCTTEPGRAVVSRSLYSIPVISSNPRTKSEVIWIIPCLRIYQRMRI